jgi:hypothetical protein
VDIRNNAVLLQRTSARYTVNHGSATLFVEWNGFSIGVSNNVCKNEGRIGVFPLEPVFF